MTKTRLRVPGYAPPRRPKRSPAKRFLRFVGWVVVAGIAFLVLFNVAYVLGLKTWMMEWGATPAEVRMSLPGDEFIPKPVAKSTRAVTIDASSEDIWPWIVQMGQGRGGMYSYELLENIMGCKINNADELLPKYQHPSVGDIIRMGPEGYPFYKINQIIPNRAFILANRDDTGTAGTWQFNLLPTSQGKTRLVVRQLGDRPSDPWYISLMWGVTDRVCFFMERKMLLTLKALVEKGHQS